MDKDKFSITIICNECGSCDITWDIDNSYVLNLVCLDCGNIGEYDPEKVTNV